MDPRVMIVDDDAGVLFLHELMVRESGMSENIRTFNSAEKGLAHLRESLGKGEKFLVFLDINMPGMSGWDFLKTLENLDFHTNVYVIMVTSSVDRSDREESGKYRHVVDFIEKPLNLETCKIVMNHEELKKAFLNGMD